MTEKFMQKIEKDGIQLIAEMLKELADPKVKMRSNIRQQSFQVFRVLTSEITRLNFERDQLVMMAAYQRMKTDVLELKEEMIPELLVGELEEKRQEAIVAVEKELDEMLKLLEFTREKCMRLFEMGV